MKSAEPNIMPSNVLALLAVVTKIAEEISKGKHKCKYKCIILHFSRFTYRLNYCDFATTNKNKCLTRKTKTFVTFCQ